jgi:hypothetical protein
MTLELTNKDYINILKYYKISIPKSKKLLKKHAEKIMAEKLCKCIKKIDLNDEVKSIGICTNTIFLKKGFKRGSFQCNKKQSVKINRLNKNKTIKNKTIKNVK